MNSSDHTPDARLQTALSTGVLLMILILGTYLLTGIPGDLDKMQQTLKTTYSSPSSPEEKSITTALSAGDIRRVTAYNGLFEPPFRTAGIPAAQETSTGTIGSYQRTTLILKGVMTKGRPLAILEDASGQTFIGAVGEEISGQKIVSIDATRVVMRDRLGTNELSVKE